MTNLRRVSLPPLLYHSNLGEPENALDAEDRPR